MLKMCKYSIEFPEYSCGRKRRIQKTGYYIFHYDKEKIHR